MRILKLRFQNLNSLVGKWEIDFTHPAYADEGIFAITGATGAGKSTILDAICLALYGATPRLGDITQNKNDLMSRQTGECESEVIFSTQSGTYRCHWGQKRARKQPDGKLQPPKHEIATFISDEIDGKLIEEKASRTKAQVEAITGMDFYRFTRAMLLAQGSFAAFLQASSDERSPILEQITGTEIYSEISKKVHEFNRNADLELTSLKDKLSGMTALSDDEEQALTEQKAELLELVTQLKVDIITTEKDKVWRQNLNYYSQQVHKLTQDKADIEQKILQFTPQQSRLKRAFKALEIKSDVEQLRTLRQHVSQQTSELNGYQQQLPTVIADVDNAKTQLQKSHANYTTAETALTQAQPLFNQIRELDSQRLQQQQLWQENKQQLQRLNQSLATNQQAFAKQQQQVSQLQNEQQSTLAKQQKIANAEQLQPNIAILTELQEDTHRLAIEQNKLSTEQIQLKKQQATDEQNTTQLSQTLSQLDIELNTAKTKLLSLERGLASLTMGQSIGELRQHAEQLWHAQNQTHNVKQAVFDWQNNHTQSQLQQDELGKIANQLNDIFGRLNVASHERQHAEQHLDLLSRNLILQAKIQDLTQERDRLINGEPCPLCGATEHPYATHKPKDSTKQDEKELALAKAQLEQLNQHIQQLSIEQNNQHNRQQFLREQLTQLTERNRQLFEQAQTNLVTLPNAHSLTKLLANLEKSLANNDEKITTVIVPFSDFLQQLDVYQQDLSQQTTALQQRLSQFEQQQTAYHAMQQHVAKLSDHRNQQANQLSLLQQAHQHQLARLTEIEQLLASKNEQASNLQQRIDGLFSPFITPHNHALFDSKLDFAQRFHGLQQLWQHHQRLSQDLQQLNEKLVSTQQNLIGLESEKANLTNNLEQLQTKQRLISEKITQLNNERQQKFGEKIVNDEENRLTNAKNLAFKLWRDSEQALNHASQQQQRIEQSIDTLTNNLAQLQSQQTHAQQHVSEQFANLGFADEADYQSATLPDTEREQLNRQQLELNEQQQRIDSLLTQAKNEEHALLASPRSELSAIQLAEKLELQKQTLSDTQQQLGGVEQLLNSNQQLKASQSELIKTIEQKTSHAKEWKDLHDLIGSSDGKKFRNFAQGLTFNIMISHANEQLKKMSDRYLLLADDKEPLMLNVMDNYQGGEIRTSKNLSGGESFIISLSLALGLSNMASHRMQVDSLFLDEGFGTLDEEALDVALDTLTSLQQSGKLIGVISHIQALKDRISSQIQVVQQSGGVSRIIGAGIRKLNS